MGFFVRIGQIAYRFATKKAAEAFAKSRKGASVVSKKPEGVTVKPGPRPQSNINQPRSADTGKMQSPRPSPAARRDTSPSTQAPKKPTAPAHTDKAPTAVGRPTKAKTEVATREPAQSKSGGRGKAPMMPKSMTKSRTNTRPNLRSKAGAAAGLRGATMPSADKAPGKTASTKPNNKSGEMPARKKTYSGRGDGLRDMATRAIDNAEYGNSPRSSKRPKARPEKASGPSKTRPKANPLDGWSDARRKALRSDKIGKDAGDGMKWVVGSNSNALVRTRDMDRVKENLRLQKMVKQTKDTSKKSDTGGR